MPHTRTFRVHFRVKPSEKRKPYRVYVDVVTTKAVWKAAKRKWKDSLAQIHEFAIQLVLVNAPYIMRHDLTVEREHEMPGTCEYCAMMEKAKITLQYKAKQ